MVPCTTASRPSAIASGRSWRTVTSPRSPERADAFRTSSERPPPPIGSPRPTSGAPRGSSSAIRMPRSGTSGCARFAKARSCTWPFHGCGRRVASGSSTRAACATCALRRRSEELPRPAAPSILASCRTLTSSSPDRWPCPAPAPAWARAAAIPIWNTLSAARWGASTTAPASPLPSTRFNSSPARSPRRSTTSGST